MPRIRSIKPSFFASEDVAELPYRARLTWVGLWTHCDDKGRCKDNTKLIKAALWALDDVSLRDVEEDLAVLAEYGRITRYEVDGKRYLQVTNWSHQRIDKPTPSVIPAPSENTPRAIHEQLRIDPVRKGGEGRGGDARGAVLPSRCPTHTGVTDAPPCGACGDARRAHDAWKLEQTSQPTTSGLPLTRGAPRCEEDGHDTELLTNCRLCASERKVAAR